MIFSFLTLLSGCSAPPVVVKQKLYPPAETMIRAEPVKQFNGKKVGDLVESYLDLISQYRKLSIRHNDLVDWINKNNKND